MEYIYIYIIYICICIYTIHIPTYRAHAHTYPRYTPSIHTTHYTHKHTHMSVHHTLPLPYSHTSCMSNTRLKPVYIPYTSYTTCPHHNTPLYTHTTYNIYTYTTPTSRPYISSHTHTTHTWHTTPHIPHTPSPHHYTHTYTHSTCTQHIYKHACTLTMSSPTHHTHTPHTPHIMHTQVWFITGEWEEREVVRHSENSFLWWSLTMELVLNWGPASASPVVSS